MMKKDKQQIPKKRFKEFVDDKDWTQCKLGENAIIKGRLGWKSLKREEYIKSGPSMIAGRHIKNGIIDWSKVDHIPMWRYEESPDIMLKNNDVIFSKDGTLGNPALIENLQDLATLNATMMLVRVFNTINPNFFYQILQGNQFQELIHLKVSGSSIPHLFQADMKKFSFSLPQILEQQKIGDFFKRLDNLINLQQDKLAKIKDLKSAYLSDLFPKEGEKYPKIRFEGFTEDWKKCKLGEIAPLRGGYSFQSKNFKVNGIPIVRITNILTNETVAGTFKYYSEMDNDSDYLLPHKAAILAMSGATTGKVSILNNPNNSKMYQNQRVGYFRNLGNENYSLISTLVKSFIFDKQLKDVLVTGAQPNVSPKEIGSFTFFIPTNIKEQEKIANFFENLDQQIEFQEQKLEKLEKIKQAYLNEMFV